MRRRKPPPGPDLFSGVPDLPSEPAPPAEPERRVYSVGELNRGIQGALQEAFPGAIWVRGEVQRLPADAARRKHIYFELHGKSGGSAVSIPVALLDWDRKRYGLQRYLDGSDPDFRLADKIEVCLQCVVDFYPPFGKLQLKLVGVDTAFTLGQLEARRREVMAWLKAHDLLELNAAISLPMLPLRVGLITSAGSAAEKDFLATLHESGRGFRVTRADCRMMGERMQAQIIGALRALATSSEVIVITRGGGSRADLSWFDQQDLAEAIARCPVPVITAIGHEIDRSIADAVAHHHCKTPTAAARDLVDRIETAEARVQAAAARIADGARRQVDAARTRGETVATAIQVQSRRRLELAQGRAAMVAARLGPAVRSRVERWIERIQVLETRSRKSALALLQRRAVRLDRGAERLVALAQTPLARARSRVDRDAERLSTRSGRLLASGRSRLDLLDQKTRLLDPARLLARGWSLTLTDDGRVLRSIEAVAPGQPLRTRLADGEIASIVERTQSHPEKDTDHGD